jgi:hypothetical protein
VDVHFPDCAPTSLVFPRGLLTISLTQDALWGGYDVTSEKYTFNVPESGTIGLALVGVGWLESW